MRPDDLILTLRSLPGIGNSTIHKFIKSCQQSMPAHTADVHRILMTIITKRHKNYNFNLNCIDKAYENSIKIRSVCNDHDIKIITYLDNIYPSIFDTTENPPAILFVRGSISALEMPALAIIGTRKPHDYAARVAYKLGIRASESGFAVTSGLAIGCDTQAHQGCMKAKGVGIAVLPCGLENVYPRQNESLAEALITEGGCIISEYPPGTKVAKHSFVSRDRLQAMLCGGIAVIQASATSGSMHAARYGLEKLGRPVAALDTESMNGADIGGNLEIINHKHGHKLSDKHDFQTFLRLIRRKDGGEIQEGLNP